MRKGTNTLAPCCESRRKSFQSKKPDISTMLGNNSPGHWQEGHDGPMNKDNDQISYKFREILQFLDKRNYMDDGIGYVTNSEKCINSTVSGSNEIIWKLVIG